MNWIYVWLMWMKKKICTEKLSQNTVSELIWLHIKWNERMNQVQGRKKTMREGKRSEFNFPFDRPDGWNFLIIEQFLVKLTCVCEQKVTIYRQFKSWKVFLGSKKLSKSLFMLIEEAY